MAGDRIFMRTDLDNDSRVDRIAVELGVADVHLVIGKLWWLWSRADSNTEDGFLPFLTPAVIDHRTLPGFTAALCHVGWLEVTPEGVRIPRFTEYNGKSAKRRLRDAQRKYLKRRACPQESGQMSATQADKKRTLGGPASASASAKEEKTSGADAPVATVAVAKESKRWLEPFGQAWLSRYGGAMPVKPNLIPLAQVKKALGEAEALIRWGRYLDATDAQYASGARFAATLGRWAEADDIAALAARTSQHVGDW